MSKSNSNSFVLGLATGVCVGFIIAILTGTLAFHMHLAQMDEVRAEFNKHLDHERSEYSLESLQKD